MPHTIYAVLYLPKPAPASWQFDAVSALIGAVVALVLAGLVYHFRDALRKSWETTVAPLAQLSQNLQANAEDRYRTLVTTRARSLIMLAHAAPLDAIFIEPELLVPPPPPESASEIDALSVSPRILSLHQILGEHPQLVILGNLGAGKTTLLAYIALICARTADGDEAMLGAAQERLPLYISLSTMDWDEPDEKDKDEEGKQSKRESGADRLVSTAITLVEGSRGMMKILHERLKAGQAIVLVDGWDELLPPQRQRAALWLSELISDMPGNLWLVGAVPRGYAPLTETGFVPLKLAAWDTKQIEPFAQQWMAAYPPTDADDKQSTTVHRQLTSTLRHAAKAGASPLELALQAYVYLAKEDAPAKRAPLFDHALDLMLQQEKEEKPWLLAACRAALEQIALDLQQTERTSIGREEIDAAIESALSLAEEPPARAATHVFRALTGERGPLCPTSPDCYTFIHPLWQAYLAAHQLDTVDSADLAERLDDPRWTDVLRFYAEIGNIGPLVTVWLRGSDDIFYTRLCTLSSWIKVAPADANWRDGAMAVLARSFLQSSHSTYIQQRLAESLAATGMSGITYLFKQALRHPDAGMRKAAVIGLTKTAQDSDLPALEAALADEDPTVYEAIIRGLAHMGTNAATRLLARIFLERDETFSIVAAEALAQCGKEGEDFLREAVESEDTTARRAAVFGLAQVAEARDLLEKVAREDEQWIVRSAAVTAMDKLEEQEKISGVAPPPEIEQLPWLISWAAAKGEGVGLGDAARRMLWRALNEGDAPTRLAAAQVLTQVGRPDDVEPLRTAMTDSGPDVVSAAMEALLEISERYALRIE